MSEVIGFFKIPELTNIDLREWEEEGIAVNVQ